MEKYSAYRDAGTGLQPFLTPVPPQASSALHVATLPVRVILGTLRAVVLLAITLLYLLLVNALSLIFIPIPFLYRLITWLFTALCARLALFVIGFWWIPVEVIAKKRGGPRAHGVKETWNPRAGDLIISNWVAWAELLWLAFRFNPVFVLPVSDIPPMLENLAPITPVSTPGRRTGTGSAAISSTPRQARPRVPILGFRKVSLLQMINATGKPPAPETSEPYLSIDEIRRKADRPVVVFPECTTSNGRALIRFADVFGDKSQVPAKGYNVFLMCVRYDPPTIWSPTITHSIPSTSLPNPIPHVFTLLSSSLSRTMSIRLLAPSESPSSGAILVSDILSSPAQDELSEVSSVLIAQLGKFKSIKGMGWEDKVSFLELYRRKSRGL
ncbi:hypothetical protein BOTBODRAFT_151226 [Botryobasidium botryosum FD-172 SS1]|uniref:Phospholipid/glycerol acyltransferase domain-containing protein n=1 Tax=Botryobasidium botryosum (strain FD-172 SS1) TaxID=930990 RepID=A0A067MY17_BOTB1|nr:hypothetical protein BOTBODRAFT_151226 [Botryobasidium botryosum FD-172 SS1]